MTGTVPATAAARSRARRAAVAASLRAATSVAVLVALYYLVPLGGIHKLSDAALLVVSLLAFALLATWQVRSITRAAYPALRAVDVLALLVPLFIVGFAAVYYVMQSNDASNFSSPLSRTDALYFTVTVFATVGFGDIVARSEAARVVVTLQMISDLAVIGVLVRLVVTAAQHTRQRAAESDPRHDGGRSR